VTWTEAVVVAHDKATTDIAVIDLALPDGSPLPAYTAGAHIDVQLDRGLVRQYSLCGPIGRAEYRLGVLDDPASRGGSKAMHALTVGSRVRISAPRNRFSLANVSHHRLFAGGIGITPLLSMVRQLAAEGREYTLHYCARSPVRAAFLSELRDDPRVVFHFDDGDPEQMLDLARDLGDPQVDTAVYVCGPSGFMDLVLRAAEGLGWATDTLHQERFSHDLAEIRAPAAADPDVFTVRVASTGAEYAIPRDRSVLDVLLESGVDAPYSCQQGICGECAVRVLAGEPDHRDAVLSDDEHAQGMYATCSSRALTPVLELDL
jgi:vanillate O-demethylase ferredoxin subunit